MHICLVPLILALNYSIFFVLKTQNEVKKMLLFVIAFFILVIMLTKSYNYLNIDGLPNGFGFFILLNFSWTILILYTIKKIINKKVDVAKSLKADSFFPAFTYLKVLTLIITGFQLFLIISKTIYIFKD
ncbi:MULTISPECIES: hypothetical protein [Flavobacterium]|uniref:hypothetical protein n=1 Tax=Flavobacterium TaxID=237 RepID=UPI001FCBE124|nr:MULTISPECIES: hypothetical protein [Flavobacterium]UOK42199.1 hypothetical protein LZF87_12880 [Flavobacterium enshiense]